MNNNGGLINEEDLSGYYSKFRDPIIFNYKKLKIASMPPPSSGGLLLGLMLNMLENFNLSKDHNDVQNILIISEIMQIAFSLRAKHIGDEDFYPVPIDKFLSKNIAADLSKKVNNKKTSKNSEINNTNIIFKENTTHFSIIDKYGNAVSNTTTLNTGFGSGIVIKDTGILMNNEMDDFSSAPGVENYFSLLGSAANKIEPKKRPLSSMTPTIVFEGDEVRVITGAQGGGRIITAVLQIIINYFEYKLGPELSVSTNRYHHQWFPEKLYYENFDNKTLHELKKLGFELEKRELEDYYSNGITSTIIIEGDKIIGISDPRLDDYSSVGSSED
jgi:gamma-glutamyltranspeptidase/glutathione hydrolase